MELEVGMQCALRFGQRFNQPVQVTGVVVFAEETGLAVVSALDDTQWDAIKLDTGEARHEGVIRLKQITLTHLSYAINMTAIQFTLRLQRG